MFTYMTETTPASEYLNPPSKSFVFNDSSINDGGYFVSGILAGEQVILLHSNSDGLDKITSILQKYASILGQIYQVRTIFGGRSGKQQLGSVIFSSDYLKPYKSQLPKWESCLSKKGDLVRVMLLELATYSAAGAGAIDCLVISRMMQLRVWSVLMGTRLKAIVMRGRRRDRNQRFNRTQSAIISTPAE